MPLLLLLASLISAAPRQPTYATVFQVELSTPYDRKEIPLGADPIAFSLPQVGWECVVGRENTLSSGSLFRVAACRKGDAYVSAAAYGDPKTVDSDRERFALGEPGSAVRLTLSCQTSQTD